MTYNVQCCPLSGLEKEIRGAFTEKPPSWVLQNKGSTSDEQDGEGFSLQKEQRQERMSQHTTLGKQKGLWCGWKASIWVG